MLKTGKNKCVATLWLLGALAVNAEPIRFPVVTSESAARIVVFEQENICVKLAAADLQSDILSITDRTLEISGGTATAPHVIMAGTVGVSGWISELEGMVPELKTLPGKSEAFVLKVVDHPSSEIDQALLIIGSDRRGTMWGIYSLCADELGVDPMKLWTEKEPQKQASLVLNVESRSDAPAIPYRGLFINDEWGLLNWKSDGTKVSHEAHGLLAETMLRLRANLYCVPMKGLPLTAADKQLFHDRGIYETASHHEILLAKTLFVDWEKFCMKRYGKKVDYAYSTNKKEMGEFFQDAINHHKRYDCVWPVGLRGAGDRPFWMDDPNAPKGGNERAAVVSEGTQWQLDLLEETAGKDYYARVPKTITLYHELLQLYQTGKLVVPEDVITIWTDDKYGNMKFPSGKSSGKQGVYYHITYCNNHNVQFVEPSRIVNEFRKILDFGADEYYLVNVGDVRESMLGTELCMKLAWGGERLDLETAAAAFTRTWAERYYPTDLTAAMVSLYMDYFNLANESKAGRAQMMYVAAISNARKFEQALEKGSVAACCAAQSAALEKAHSGRLEAWNALLERAEQLADQMDDARQVQFLHTDMIYHIQMHRLPLKWNRVMLSAMQSAADGDSAVARQVLIDSESILDEMDAAIESSQTPRFKGWYQDRIPNRAPARFDPITRQGMDEERLRLIQQLP